MDIILSHIDEDEARLTLHYSVQRLQLNGHGSDWHRARGIRRGVRPSSPATSGSRRSSSPSCLATVAETRKRLVIEELEAALENVDSSIENDNGAGTSEDRARRRHRNEQQHGGADQGRSTGGGEERRSHESAQRGGEERH